MRLRANDQNTYGITFWRTPRILEISFGRRTLDLYL